MTWNARSSLKQALKALLNYIYICTFRVTLYGASLQESCPSYMYDLLKCIANLHARSGRYSALNLVSPRYNRGSEGGRTFSVSATRLWNSLPTNLKKGISVTSFRKATYSLTRYNDVDHFSLSAI